MAHGGSSSPALPAPQTRSLEALWGCLVNEALWGCLVNGFQPFPVAEPTTELDQSPEQGAAALLLYLPQTPAAFMDHKPEPAQGRAVVQELLSFLAPSSGKALQNTRMIIIALTAQAGTC